MTAHLTDKALRVMERADEERQRFNHKYIGTGHILLALIKDGSGVAAYVLKQLGIDWIEFQKEFEKQLRHGPGPQHASHVIECANEEAENMNHNYVGTEHILLGLLRENECSADMLPGNHGLTSDRVRKEIKDTFEQMESAFKERTNQQKSEPPKQ
jgi:ATP-dependent Clp protease ATP-binding subunit ClpC